MAEKIGIRGGAIAGTNYMDIFVPLLLEPFGPRWFEKGIFSIFYTYMTTDREEVRAVIGLPPKGVEDVQVAARLEMPSGQIVGQGHSLEGQGIRPGPYDRQSRRSGNGHLCLAECPMQNIVLTDAGRLR